MDELSPGAPARPRVAILVNSLTGGGAEKIVSVILEQLCGRGFPPLLICLERDDFFRVPAEVETVYLSGRDGSESGLRKLLALPLAAWRLRRLCRSRAVSLVQSHIFRANYVNVLARMLGSRSRAQIVIPGLPGYYRNQGLLGRVNLFLIRLLYPRADLVVCKSEGMRRDLLRLARFRTGVRVINNPCDLEAVGRLAAADQGGFCFDADVRYLVCVGRLVALKRFEVAVEALELLRRTRPRVELLFVGDGDQRAVLQRRAAELGLGGCVHFAGRVANPYALMARAALFVLTSETEGFPNVLVEAMACGLPVVSSDCDSGPREILAPGTGVEARLGAGDGPEEAEFGLLVPVGDARALADAAGRLLDNGALADAYRKKGLARARDFGVERIMDEYADALGLGVKR